METILVFLQVALGKAPYLGTSSPQAGICDTYVEGLIGPYVGVDPHGPHEEGTHGNRPSCFLTWTLKVH